MEVMTQSSNGDGAREPEGRPEMRVRGTDNQSRPEDWLTEA